MKKIDYLSAAVSDSIEKNVAAVWLYQLLKHWNISVQARKQAIS